LRKFDIYHLVKLGQRIDAAQMG